MVLYSYTHMSSLLSSLLYITFGFPNSYEHHATPLKPVVMVLWPAKGSQSVQFSHSVLSYYFQPHGLQHARIPCPSPTSRACSNSCPSNQWCHPTISFLLSPPSPPALNFPQHKGLFHWVGYSHQVAKVLELQLQLQSFQWVFRVDLLKIDWLHLLAGQGTLKSLL